MEHTTVWIAYALGAFLTLAGKLFMYLKNSKRFNKSWTQSAKDWFALRTAEDYASWVGTILVVWVLGYVYIEQVIDLTGLAGKVVDKVPVSCPIAALFGYLAEMIAPAILKKIVSMTKKQLKVE